MSFIKTPNGNLVPFSNIKVVKPRSNGGSRVHLITGESFIDTRDPEKIFEQGCSVDLTPMITSVFHQLNEMKKELVTRLSVLAGEVNAVSIHTTESVGAVLLANKAFTQRTKSLDSSYEGLVVSTTRIDNVTKELEHAIQEAIQDDRDILV